MCEPTCHAPQLRQIALPAVEPNVFGDVAGLVLTHEFGEHNAELSCPAESPMAEPPNRFAATPT